MIRFINFNYKNGKKRFSNGRKGKFGEKCGGKERRRVVNFGLTMKSGKWKTDQKKRR